MGIVIEKGASEYFERTACAKIQREKKKRSREKDSMAYQVTWTTEYCWNIGDAQHCQ